MAMRIDTDAFGRRIKKARDKVFNAIHEKQNRAVIAALDAMHDASPQWTGWYASNHRVATGQNIRSFEVSPPARPKTKGAMLIDKGALLSREMGTLQSRNLFDNITIGNATKDAALIEEGTMTRPQGNIFAIGATVATDYMRSK